MNFFFFFFKKTQLSTRDKGTPPEMGGGVERGRLGGGLARAEGYSGASGVL